ncbi:MAG TPA: hypothetical protein PKZ56_01715 [Candidatus Paceibacterota bacterium]|nr:hypothetical protein [Candidatus Paceibacterota bacterium]
MLSTLFNCGKKADPNTSRSFDVIINRISRKVVVTSTTLSFSLKNAESVDLYAGILLAEQVRQRTHLIEQSGNQDNGMTFSIANHKVSILLEKEEQGNLTSIANVRSYLTKLRIPVKGFVKHETYS